MPTLETDDANILDAEAVNWRLIVYPLLAVLILLVGGFGAYFYHQNQRDQLEEKARAAFLQAKTPEELVKVSDQFPGSDHALLALMSAATDSFAKRDFAAATREYQRIVDTAGVDPQLRDSAQLGVGSCLEANGKADAAISAYLEVAYRGDKSPFAPYAYSVVARLYDQRGDKVNERQILTQMTSLDPDSPFVRHAQNQLKEMSLGSLPPLTVVPAAGTENAPVTVPPDAAAKK